MKCSASYSSTAIKPEVDNERHRSRYGTAPFLGVATTGLAWSQTGPNGERRHGAGDGQPDHSAFDGNCPEATDPLQPGWRRRHQMLNDGASAIQARVDQWPKDNSRQRQND